MTSHQRVRVGACLSLSGAFARFGAQAARGLETWQSLDGAADLVVEDDRSDPGTLEAALRYVAPRCDVLLGPYSTRLMRAARRLAAREGGGPGHRDAVRCLPDQPARWRPAGARYGARPLDRRRTGAHPAEQDGRQLNDRAPIQVPVADG